MRITHGETRHVILTRHLAFKVARFRIGSIALRVLTAPVRWNLMGETGSRFENGDPITSIGIWSRLQSFIARGIRANRQEFRIFQEHPELPIAPVHRMYLGGLVLVMERGAPVDAEESRMLRARYASCEDLGLEEHVCRFANRLLYIDYGHPHAPRAFGI